MPHRKRLSRPLGIKFTRESDEAVEKHILLSNVLKEAFEAVLVSEIRYMSPENMPPSIIRTRPFIAHAKDHVVEHYVYDYHPKGEYVGRCVLPGTCPRLRASP